MYRDTKIMYRDTTKIVNLNTRNMNRDTSKILNWDTYFMYLGTVLTLYAGT